MPTQGMFVDKVKELIVEELKALRELQSVKDDIFPDDITLYTDAERTKEITSDEMSCLIKLGANLQKLIGGCRGISRSSHRLSTVAVKSIIIINEHNGGNKIYRPID